MQVASGPYFLYVTTNPPSQEARRVAAAYDVDVTRVRGASCTCGYGCRPYKCKRNIEYVYQMDPGCSEMDPAVQAARKALDGLI